MLNEQLQKELDQEAKAAAKKMTGRVPIFRMGYEAGHYDGADKYASKWQEEKELRERYEKALKEIARKLAGINDTVTNDIERIANEALPPKTGSDE